MVDTAPIEVGRDRDETTELRSLSRSTGLTDTAIARLLLDASSPGSAGALCRASVTPAEA